MEALKNFIISLVTTIILISSIELISPSNSMKKYIKLVLGLIIIAVMINPIINFFTNGQDEIISAIENYESLINIDSTDNSNLNHDVNEELTEVFSEDLNSKCNVALKEKFSEYDFDSNIKCNVNYNDMSYEIEEVKVGIKSSKIQAIEKVQISSSYEGIDTVNEYTEDELRISKYLENLLDITSDKIKIYRMNG